jgi:hypothetical protein
MVLDKVLKQVLTDTSARTPEQLPVVAAAAPEFIPWDS